MYYSFGKSHSIHTEPVSNSNNITKNYSSETYSPSSFGGGWGITTTDTTYTYTTYDRIAALEKEIKEQKEMIRLLEKKLNDFIDNPDRIKSIRKVDPFDEEDWND